MDEEILFQQSLSFIKENLDATFDAVPGYLRDYWRITDNPNTGNRDATIQWSIFLYALDCYKESKNIRQFDMQEDEVFDLFCGWQLILFFGEKDGKSILPIKSVKLFGFDELDSELRKMVKRLENE